MLSFKLAQKGVKNIRLYDVSSTHPSWIVSECFRASHIVFAASSYNAGLFPAMETVLLDLKAHALNNRTIALMENGSWAPTAMNSMKTILSDLKNITYIEPEIHIKSSIKQNQTEDLEKLADAIVKSMNV
jgi:flavorubredoxin